MNDTFESGRIIGSYRIVRPLGAGGMGAVYEVEHLKLRTHRALKVFAVESENVELHRRRFLSEGKMLAALDHPRVVRVHEFDVDAESGRPYFVMDLVLSPDGSPRTLADPGAFGEDETRAAAFFRDICEGLDYVHSLGIVHRDIKLENILIDPDGRAVLSDFGISRIFDDALRQRLDITLTMPQDEAVIRRLGSAFYLAPEQQGETPDKATPASDAWALGVMMFRFLTGFWFERTNREKCLALLADCELPWRPLIERLCSETPDERTAEGGFVSLADTLKGKRDQSASAAAKRRRMLVWGAALAVVAVGLAFALLRPGKGASETTPQADQPVLCVSIKYDDLRLLKGGKCSIPGDMHSWSHCWTESAIDKALAAGTYGDNAIAGLLADAIVPGRIVNGKRWETEIRPGIMIDFPQGIGKVFMRGRDAGDLLSRALDVTNLDRLVLRLRPDDGFVSNSTCFVEAQFCYKSVAQVDEAKQRLEKLLEEVKPIKHISSASSSRSKWLSMTTSFDIKDANEVFHRLLGEVKPASRRQKPSAPMTVAWGWIYLGAFLMLAELMVPGFVIFFFGLASASVGGCCFVFGDAFGATWQLAAFSVFSVLYLMTLRRLAKKIFCGTSETADVDFCHDTVGRFGMVTEEIAPPLAGRVMIGDAEWTAVADAPVAAGALVRVISQQNLTMKVKEVKQ